MTVSIKQVKQRTYLNKDFDALRADLLEYARAFFPTRIKDFSDSSAGGMLLDMAAYVGDVCSFYLDYQFNELDPTTAIEIRNIDKFITSYGIKSVGAMPAVVDVSFSITVPAETVGSIVRPQVSALPKILAGTIVKSSNGVLFELIDELDFTSQRSDGSLSAMIEIDKTLSNGQPSSYVLTLIGQCISGMRVVETFNLDAAFKSFLEIVLSNEDVTDIISVTDSAGNEYFEVDSLAQDTVFKVIKNTFNDRDAVHDAIELMPAPYRYTRSMSILTRLTALKFGSGRADTTDDDIIPDPTQFAIPLYGKKTFSRISINPGDMLRTHTLGISPYNTTLTVTYRYGGGLRHNAAIGSIRAVDTLRIKFPGNPTQGVISSVRGSIDVFNEQSAAGGDDAPTLTELRTLLERSKHTQSRVVTREDLLARVYTLPSNLGRIFRASVQPNRNNPLASLLYVISRDVNGQLAVSPDRLKKNLQVYLDQLRLISDAIDILDARIINVTIEFKALVDAKQENQHIVLQNAILRLKERYDISKMQIDAPIIISDVIDAIFRTPGIVSVVNVLIKNVAGTVLGKTYSDVVFDVASNTYNGVIIPPVGGIFEVKYPEFDIAGSIV